MGRSMFVGRTTVHFRPGRSLSRFHPEGVRWPRGFEFVQARQILDLFVFRPEGLRWLRRTSGLCKRVPSLIYLYFARRACDGCQGLQSLVKEA